MPQREVPHRQPERRQRGPEHELSLRQPYLTRLSPTAPTYPAVDVRQRIKTIIPAEVPAHQRLRHRGILLLRFLQHRITQRLLIMPVPNTSASASHEPIKYTAAVVDIQRKPRRHIPRAGRLPGIHHAELEPVKVQRRDRIEADVEENQRPLKERILRVRYSLSAISSSPPPAPLPLRFLRGTTHLPQPYAPCAE